MLEVRTILWLICCKRGHMSTSNSCVFSLQSLRSYLGTHSRYKFYILHKIERMPRVSWKEPSPNPPGKQWICYDKFSNTASSVSLYLLSKVKAQLKLTAHDTKNTTISWDTRAANGERSKCRNQTWAIFPIMYYRQIIWGHQSVSVASCF